MGNDVGAAERRKRKVQFSDNAIVTLEVTDQFAARCRFGTVEEANSAAARFLGVAQLEGLLGRSLLDFIADDYRPVIQELLDLHVVELDPIPLMIHTPDGKSREAEIKIHPARELGDGSAIVTLRDLAAQTRAAMQARRMDALFRSLVDNAMHMICRCHGERVVYINSSGRDLIGLSPDDGEANWPIWTFFDEPYRSLFHEDLSALLDETGIVPVRFRRIDGSAIDVQVRITRLPDEDNDIEFMLEARDITGQNKAVSALRAMNDSLERRVAERTSELNIQKGFLERLLTAMPNPVWWKGLDGRYLGFNNAFATLLNADSDTWVGRSIEDVAPGDHVALSKARDEQALNGPPIAYEMELQAGDGKRQFLVNKTAWLNERQQPAGLIGVMVDISRQKDLENELRRLATTDALTGTFNRRHFMEQAAEMVAVARRHHRAASVMMLDIDHFKRINDTYGHPVGDLAIKALATTCMGALRGSDILGRLGGEEFAICLPETDLTGCRILAERMREAVAAICVEADGHQVRFTASIGIAGLEEADHSVDIVLARADQALYRAKNGGRNRVVADRDA
ncbi:FOG: GGDEF domain [Magnetospirillum sp. LM-5]|uniref:sensor domain-containing diguanylate cyclase n=1 Tax=Magnetospirillum sp. LM-5 TaxID=2681466 RepID=UPI00137ED9DA|nr:diguanylate cyclase [Magnetospirillum sp. LM-5]CAA7616516.1 FOG: GGDEF domain [Magnetospirillum sp. LM-5]